MNEVRHIEFEGEAHREWIDLYTGNGSEREYLISLRHSVYKQLKKKGKFADFVLAALEQVDCENNA